MPLYDFTCAHGCREERYLTLAQHRMPQACFFHWMAMQQIIAAPLVVSVQPDIFYTSPIDDRPISSWAAREEDLKRHGCRAYDPAMKQDAERFRNESQASLEKAMDETVERAITKMPTKQRGQLYSDLVDKGMTAEPIRSTA